MKTSAVCAWTLVLLVLVIAIPAVAKNTILIRDTYQVIRIDIKEDGSLDGLWSKWHISAAKTRVIRFFSFETGWWENSTAIGQGVTRNGQMVFQVNDTYNSARKGEWCIELPNSKWAPLALEKFKIGGKPYKLLDGSIIRYGTPQWPTITFEEPGICFVRWGVNGMLWVSNPNVHRYDTEEVVLQSEDNGWHEDCKFRAHPQVDERGNYFVQIGSVENPIPRHDFVVLAVKYSEANYASLNFSTPWNYGDNVTLHDGNDPDNPWRIEYNLDDTKEVAP